MNISKRKQGILAIICTIAMIVTSITVYNPREVKADPSATVDGKQYSATVKIVEKDRVCLSGNF